jgi:Protein of unknown function (DUF3551)
MKSLLLAFGICVVATAMGGPAKAMNYPWCGYDGGGGTNCGFVTVEQCMASISGNGGFCNRNTQYIPGEPRDFNPWTDRANRRSLGLLRR